MCGGFCARRVLCAMSGRRVFVRRGRGGVLAVTVWRVCLPQWGVAPEGGVRRGWEAGRLPAVVWVVASVRVSGRCARRAQGYFQRGAPGSWGAPWRGGAVTTVGIVRPPECGCVPLVVGGTSPSGRSVRRRAGCARGGEAIVGWRSSAWLSACPLFSPSTPLRPVRFCCRRSCNTSRPLAHRAGTAA